MILKWLASYVLYFPCQPEINEPPEEIKAKVNERASPRKSIFEVRET